VTIGVAVKVHAGEVLAADSATTLETQDGAITKVYYHANKIFDLYEGLPVGGMTWGLGNLGPYAIATMARDLRRRLMGTAADKSLKIDPDKYSIEEIASRVRTFFYEQAYLAYYPAAAANRPELGLLVAGYSSDSDLPEEWLVEVDAEGNCAAPAPLRTPTDGFGYEVFGQPAAVRRLMDGYDERLGDLLIALGLEASQLDSVLEFIRDQLKVDPVMPQMPMQDAIELAVYLAGTTAQWHRFLPGAPAPTVGGLIQVAWITKHDGFNWERRGEPHEEPDK